jgi:hypothetical protein
MGHSACGIRTHVTAVRVWWMPSLPAASFPPDRDLAERQVYSAKLRRGTSRGPRHASHAPALPSATAVGAGVHLFQAPCAVVR